MTVATETHPYAVTVEGFFVYRDTDGIEQGRVPVSVTVGDNCCEEHSRSAGESVLRAAARSRSGEEIPFGISVEWVAA